MISREKQRLRLIFRITHVSKDTPPAFIWHTFDDTTVPVENSLLFALSMKKHHIPFEMHIFPHGVHGLSLCDERTGISDEHINVDAGKWVRLCIQWLKIHFKN